MEKTVRFFKQDNKWYADIPNHTLDENEMVMGSDIILEMFANGAKELNITLSDDDTSNSFLTLKREEHDSEGAWYSFDGLWYTSIMNVLIDKLGLVENKIWICNVTHDVFGEHPETIYINKINGDVL